MHAKFREQSFFLPQRKATATYVGAVAASASEISPLPRCRRRPRAHTCPNPLRQNTNCAATALHDRLGEIPTPNSFRVAASRLIPARSSRCAPRRRGHAPSNCRAYGSARSCRHPASPPLRRRFLRPRRGRSGVESISIAEQRVISSRAGE
jgi:hypothetical protein